MQEETARLLRVAVVAALVAGGIGFLVGKSRGEAGMRDRMQTRLESREALMVDAIGEKDRGISACRQVIRRATRIIRGRTLYIENLYDDSLDHIREAYQLGVQGNEEELAGGLGRSIYESSQLENVAAQEISIDGWTGWVPDEQFAACQAASLGVPAGREP